MASKTWGHARQRNPSSRLCIPIWHALTTMTSVIHNTMSERTIKPNVQMSLDDYAVSSNVGFCWALRLSQVLAFTECPIDSQAEESSK